MISTRRKRLEWISAGIWMEPGKSEVASCGEWNPKWAHVILRRRMLPTYVAHLPQL